MRKSLFLQLILSKIFSRQIECRTDKPARNFLTQTWRIAVWKPKKIVIIYIFSKSFVAWKKIHWHIDFSFDNPDGRFESEIQKIFAQTQKWLINWKFYSNFFFFNMILWAFKNKFERTRRKHVTKKSKTFRSRIEIAFSMKTLLKSKIYPKIASRPRWL